MRAVVIAPRILVQVALKMLSGYGVIDAADAANAATNAGQSIVRIFVQQMSYAKSRNETPEIAFFAGGTKQ